MRVIAVLLAGGLAAVTSAGPAHAGHSTMTVEPEIVVLYRSGPSQAGVRLDDLGSAYRLTTWLECFDCPSSYSYPTSDSSYPPLRQVDEDSWAGTITFAPTAPTGRWISAYYAGQHDAHPEDPDPLEERGVWLQVKRNTMLSFNAAPEEVTDSTIALGGRLTRMTPDQGYVGYAGKTLTVQFKPRGGTFADHSTVTTDSTGRFGKHVSASGDGTWRVRFAGTGHHHRETSRHDYIDVQ